MQAFYQYLTIYGTVISVDVEGAAFTLECRSGDTFQVKVGPTTEFSVMTNLDGLNRDRVPNLKGVEGSYSPSYKVEKYIQEKITLSVEGIYQDAEGKACFSARMVHLMYYSPGYFMFEETHWWIVQITQMADKWLDDLFDSTRSYKIDDFSKLYGTNLNIMGGATDDTIQECATLSRLVYGLSSAYLLTGAERYYLAAKAGVAYQREAYRSLTHDGECCIWSFGRRKISGGSKLVFASENPDDLDTIPLYEQIYALAGLAQYYRISLEWEVLEDIRRTINTFQKFYHDDDAAKKRMGYPGLGGYFSHLDYATMRPDADALGQNQSRKNWNSIGDHIPAYLVNLLLALDPLPKSSKVRNLEAFRDTCRTILRETCGLILDYFPDPDSDYVNERFHYDFEPDHHWGWQQNRAIVGHNLKIAWNLTRVAFYYQYLGATITSDNEKKDYTEFAKKCLETAKDIGQKMANKGLDPMRGGVFDAVERKPGNEFPIKFSWGTTKDFWQQEQGILAYLILHGTDPKKDLWLALARECMMFWNLYFLDRDHQGIYFRTTGNGRPFLKGSYAQKGGHSISGYHAFELNYLAHLYIRTFIFGGDENHGNFCLYFKVAPNCEQESINVLPDFLPPRSVSINRIRVDGVDHTDELRPNSPDDFQIKLSKCAFETTVAVDFKTFKPNKGGSQ